jgi:sulfur relay protein TusB/DsrH
MTSTTLHIVPTSPTATRLEELWALLAPGDAVLFIEDGTYFAQQPEALASLAEQRLHFLEEDATARGVSPGPALALVDYAGFVALSADYPRSVSWY